MTPDDGPPVPPPEWPPLLTLAIAVFVGLIIVLLVGALTR